MNVGGQHYRSIWPSADGSVCVIDQSRLPHEFAVVQLDTLAQAAAAIQDMQVRGAPLIGATAAYGVALALRARADDAMLDKAMATLLATRPTAVNLRWALQRMHAVLHRCAPAQRADVAWREAAVICDQDVAANHAIGEHGLRILRELAAAKHASVNVMTHCNAGWLATVDGGTALAPVYAAFDAGLDVHVWVSETRPRNQGAALTCWELAQHGVPHTLIVDNAAGLLMRRGDVDIVIVGADRVSANGDVCNKIGTYLKALAARDCGVPFYAALPGSTIDWTMNDGGAIPIEQRASTEVTHVTGWSANGGVDRVAITSAATTVSNFGFDVTPARLVTGLITERGICAAQSEALKALYSI